MTDESSVAHSIGRYRVLGELGRGGMGVVYRGFDPVIRRAVALKTIAFDAQSSDGAMLRERLYREAAAAGTLTHPSIVTIFDIVEDGATTAVAMEYVEGQTLDTHIARVGTLRFDDALAILEHVCSALDYAGSRGIVHRDIKPANILLMPNGLPKILDFGIARIAMSGITQTSTIMGSPCYMSPEQVRGLPLDPRSDLFSAAVVFYEMLAGERPFGGDDVATTMYRIVHEPPRAMDEVNPAISRSVTGVLDSALAKEPSQRFQSGRELVDALRCAWDGGTDQRSPATAVRPPAGESGRSRKRLLMAGLVASGLLFTAVVITILVGMGSRDPIADSSAAPPAYAGVTPDGEPGAVAATTTPAPAQPAVQAAGVVPRQPEAQSAADEHAPASVVDKPAPHEPSTTRAVPAPPAVPPGVDVRAEPPPAPPAEPLPMATVAYVPPTTPAPVTPAAVKPAAPAPTAPAESRETLLRVTFDGLPYPVTIFAGSERLGRVESAEGSFRIEPGSTRVRAVSEAMFLDVNLGTVSVKAGEQRSLALPGIASAVFAVRGENYAGVRLEIDGRPVLGPYPAQVGRIAAGRHRVVYRWTTGAESGREIADTLTLSADGHFRVQAVLDNDKLVVQQLR